MKDYFNKKTLAKYYKDDKIVKGDLCFDERGITFNPHDLDIQKEEIRIEYLNIDNISKWDTFGIIPNGITILTKDERKYRFVINRRNLVVNFIKTYMIKNNLHINKILVAYFSIDDKTTSIAKDISEKIDADIFEIKPKIPYKPNDFSFYTTQIPLNKNSRGYLEYINKNARPEMIETVSNSDDYDIIIMVFKLEYCLPRIINTFIESQDYSNKILIPFYVAHDSSPNFDRYHHNSIKYDIIEQELQNTYRNYKLKTGKILFKKIDRYSIEYFIYHNFWHMYNSF